MNMREGSSGLYKNAGSGGADAQNPLGGAADACGQAVVIGAGIANPSKTKADRRQLYRERERVRSAWTGRGT